MQVHDILELVLGGMAPVHDILALELGGMVRVHGILALELGGMALVHDILVPDEQDDKVLAQDGMLEKVVHTDL